MFDSVLKPNLKPVPCTPDGGVTVVLESGGAGEDSFGQVPQVFWQNDPEVRNGVPHLPKPFCCSQVKSVPGAMSVQAE